MIMLLGDTHGNTNFVVDKAIPAAVGHNCDFIYQVGDFGYWEHQIAGQEYLDAVNAELGMGGVRMVFIQGNHDKVSLIAEKYSMVDGFYFIRSNIWYAPNGVTWSPDSGKTNFIALGGAYSVDKQWRLKQERAMAYKSYSPEIAEMYSNPLSETLWFPEEEMTDKDMDTILDGVTDRIDVILAHDKPTSSSPPMNLYPIPECQPNQARLQRALTTLKPKLFVHGHLHVRYTEMLRTGDDDTFTQILGLGSDGSDKASDAWEFLDI
jgi:calcineurin-like phosphoesterase family protein